jgi:hypothetical protein
MLKASAPQKRMRKGSWCVDEWLNSRWPRVFPLDARSHGLIWW